MSKPRTRHPDEPKVRKYKTGVDAKGRFWNGKSKKPLKFGSLEEGIAARSENLHDIKTGPPDKMLAVMASGAVLRPQQIALVRQGIVNIVDRNLQKASDVLDGSAKWDSNQTRLFLGFLDKVAPRMSDNLHRHTMEPAGKDYARLSLAELEAALHDVLDEAKVIEGEPAPEKPKRKFRPATKEKRELQRRAAEKRKLALKEVEVRYLEKEPEVLPPLTREQDDENRRQAARSAEGLRKRRARADAMRDLELLGQLDPVLAAAEKFIKTPPGEAE